MDFRIWILNCFLVIAYRSLLVSSHGRLMDPPARNSMWRFGFPSPVDFNDNELYCGGRGVQWGKYDGKCGVCGDEYGEEQPRSHEMGGVYWSGLNTRRYAPGQTIDISVELTANHWGHFEIKLCPANYNSKREMQECFDKYPLKVAGTNSTKYIISKDTPKKANFRYKVKLPAELTCPHCIMQWTYHAANTWGICPDGSGAVGCGNQETFVNCADISIVSGSGSRPGVDTYDNPYMIYVSKDGTFASPPLSPGQDYEPLVVKEQLCLAAGDYAGSKENDRWCMANCLKYPPNCPTDRCTCITDCYAIGALTRNTDADLYCQINCLTYSRDHKCPHDKCECK